MQIHSTLLHLSTLTAQEVIAQYMNDKRPENAKTMSIEEATYDKIKDQVVAKQKQTAFSRRKEARP